MDTTAAQQQALATPDLTSYDLILVNTSAGKDSSVMAHLVAQLAASAGVLDRVVAVHATFAEEWEGTEDLARRQCAALGIPLEVCSRGEALLDYVERRGKWMDSTARYCTSEFKRSPIDKVITRLATVPGKVVRVLNCMGLRAQESSARAKRSAFERDARRSNGRRIVDAWLPIFRMTEAQVWGYIAQHDLEQHKAYALGMPRLSCAFCVFAPRNVLLLAGEHNREMLDRYVAVEDRIGHTFRKDLTIRSIKEALDSGERADPKALKSWTM